jgi:hypothetical protein
MKPLFETSHIKTPEGRDIKVLRSIIFQKKNKQKKVPKVVNVYHLFYDGAYIMQIINRCKDEIGYYADKFLEDNLYD